jgi:hypothetical protein
LARIKLQILIKDWFNQEQYSLTYTWNGLGYRAFFFEGLMLGLILDECIILRGLGSKLQSLDEKPKVVMATDPKFTYKVTRRMNALIKKVKGTWRVTRRMNTLKKVKGTWRR